ncbi:hypothetical protein B0O99DRAFT_627713 [Bisporella sp. PMI_857]|nr:hypothetical protein B0O99DRAFT_627713 [Bisporella sp. PMI_857]
MPLLYGEGGKKAFIRLQEEIMKNSDDHTLFAWTVPEEIESLAGMVKEVGLLAEHPVFFRSSKDVLSFRRWDVSDTFSMTNKGLRITVPLTADAESPDNWIAYLDCHQLKNEQRCAVAIPLQQLSRDGDQFARVAQATLDIPLSLEHDVPAEKRAIYIRKEIIKPDVAFREGDAYRLREFQLLQTPSTHELVEKYGSAREGSSSQTLLAPPKTTSYWIDPLAWANWRVACLFEEKESVYRAQTSSFIIVMGYDANAGKPWCVVEPYDNQSLRDVWDAVRHGKEGTVNKVLLKGRSVVRVNLKPAVGNPGVVEVYVQCNHGLRDSSDDAELRKMDPLSIFSGTDGVADICMHLVKYLEDTCVALEVFKDDQRKNSQSDLTDHESSSVAVYSKTKAFIKDLETLGAANKAIQAEFHRQISAPRSPIPETFWKQTATSLKNCRKAAMELDRLLRDIYRKAPKSPRDITFLCESLNLVHNNFENKQLIQSLGNLSIYHKVLHMFLLIAILYDNEGGLGDLNRPFDELSREVEASKSLITTMLNTSPPFERSAKSDRIHELTIWTAINDLRTSVDAALTVMKLETSNKYFEVPQALSSIFTGQSDVLASLKELFFEAPATVQDHQQRRFVLYGIGGSGKTQLCTKFACDNRDRYWGVFWIDLSSPERANQTCIQIAKIGGVEPTVNATMNWLSSLKREYLLILDSADDQSLSLTDYLPGGSSGHVLITTRNPFHKIYGNIGHRYLQLQALNTDAASLLLKAAVEPLPWNDNVVSLASRITEALGLHPLTILHAGAAIRNGICTLDTYLKYHDRSLQRIRAGGHRRFERFRGSDMDHSIYASFEVVYSNITSKDTLESEDAIQLLKVFAFFHYKDIRFDILERAIQNPAKERGQQQKDEEKHRLKEIEGKPRRPGWFRTLPSSLLTWMLANRTPPVLPDAIRDGQLLRHFDPDRLRSALKELVQTSLIVHNDSQNSDSYSMHPLIHKWARERPEMSVAEQAVWSEAAATMLSDSLLLPPLGSAPEEEAFRASVLPHVEHVLACQKSIRDRISYPSKVARGLIWRWFSLSYTMTAARAIIYMKFSLVLAQGGLFSDARELQEPMKDYLLKVLGIEHKSTRRVMLGLANSYMNLGEYYQAEDIMTRVLEACEIILGSGDHETLLTKGIMAETLFKQGRYTEARKLQEEVVIGLTDVKGRSHEDTVTAIDDLGITIMHLREDLRAAQRCHREAMNGLEDILGPDHFKTIKAKENLAVVAVYIPGEDLKSAAAMIDKVLEARKSKWGGNLLHRLLPMLSAMLNKAKIKCALNEFDEAEHLIRNVLQLAERNFEPEHPALMIGKCSLAKVLNEKKQWEEAEKILLEVIEHFRDNRFSRQDHHLYRFEAMKELSKCYKLQCRTEECLDLCHEILGNLKLINREWHPIAKEVEVERRTLSKEEDEIIPSLEVENLEAEKSRFDQS